MEFYVETCAKSEIKTIIDSTGTEKQITYYQHCHIIPVMQSETVTSETETWLKLRNRDFAETET